MERNVKVNVTPGINFVGLLTIVFITLKLCKVIDWSWLWILAPIWAPIAFVLVAGLLVICLVGIFYLIKFGIEKHQSRKRMKKMLSRFD